jgi:hypothetical protein
MANTERKHWADLDLEIIDAAVELDRLLTKLDPNDRRRWAGELKAARDRIFGALKVLQDELGVSPQGQQPGQPPLQN